MSGTGIKRYFTPISRPTTNKATDTVDGVESHLDSPRNKRFCHDNLSALSSPPVSRKRDSIDENSPIQTTPVTISPTSTPSTKIKLLTTSSASPATPTSRIASTLRATHVSTPSSSVSYSPASRKNDLQPTSARKTNPTAPANLEDSVQHLHQTYKFLYPPHRKDIQGRTPDDPDYDEKTLLVPTNFLDSQTPALRQWWLIKQRNMDAILFFKMGKFYELFNEDAVIGVNNLDIIYMKGDETKPAHAGFPEISYEKYSKILIDRGFKVLRVEQTETPAMMEERCQETGKRGKFDKVVKREVCRVTTKGTQMLGVMESIFHSSLNQYLLAIRQSTDECLDPDGNRTVTFGVCFVDVTIGRIHIGQFSDDNNLSRLNILLAHHVPTEVLYEKGNLSKQAYQALLKTGALLTILKYKKEFWPIKQALSYLKSNNIFMNDGGQFEWPAFLTKLFVEGEASESLMQLDPKEEYQYALNCFGALVFYLKSQMIADQVMSCATFEFYSTPLDRNKTGTLSSSSSDIHLLPPMILDHVALRNLEVFQNSSGGTELTLYDSVNNCKTHFGQRLLKNWLCSPLSDVKQLENRLDAVQALISNNCASMMNEIVHVLSQTPDLERLLSKIKSQCFKSESDCRAVMFDGDLYSKAKITSFLNLIQNFKRLRKFISSISNRAQDCESKVLRRLLSFTTEDGLFPEYGSTLEYFETAFDHDIAKKTGKIIPATGVDKQYDNCQEKIDTIKDQLDSYLEEQKAALGCRHLEYFGSAKNRYQIQVPEAYCKKVPSEYRIETTRKGFKRYYTPTIDKLFQKLTAREEEMKKTLDGIMSTIFEQFSRKFKLWSAAIECIAVLDVLQSIATFVRSLKAKNIDVCRPEFVTNQSSPIIHYTEGRHPALVKINRDYIPNDLTIDDKTILLSGANMGGKSTLMRQTATLVILAQIGSFVPAAKLQLTPVDRIFSRMGASDRLIEGDSTFYMELVETSAMLQCASNKSLLLLDELGRGTSTYDGTAIAYATLKEINENIRCRCLFSTHYHTLVRDFQSDKRVRLAHMACKVEKEVDCDVPDADPLGENITFLYKIADGPVGRSYGFNVARLAGIDSEIIREAVKKSRELELRCKVLEKLQEHCSNGRPPIQNSELRKRILDSLAN